MLYCRLLGGLLLISSLAVARPAITELEAQQAHTLGLCGQAGPGTGLSPSGKGWIRSIIPGRHEFRVIGPGSVGVTVAKHTSFDFDVARPYYIEIHAPMENVQWKMTGYEWGPIPTAFLYPLN